MPPETPLERLDRWAGILPDSEPLPITADEAFEVCEHFVLLQSPKPLNEAKLHAATLQVRRMLADGRLLYRGHRVVLIR